jgi:homoaconitase/3-isopropylmalate dehydratase large subunit
LNILKTNLCRLKERIGKKALTYWKQLYSDKDCKFDKEINIDAKEIEPLVTWGTSPQDVASVTSIVPDPSKESD